MEYKGRVTHITHYYRYETFKKQVDREESIIKLLKDK